MGDCVELDYHPWRVSLERRGESARKREVNGQRGEEKGLGRAWNGTLERVEVDKELEIKTGLEKIGR